jgi:hypothetical protein
MTSLSYLGLTGRRGICFPKISYILCHSFHLQMSTKIAVYIPETTISSLKKEFNIEDADLNDFVTSMIERRIAEHIGETNSKVFSESETKELEDDLKGLGYI